MPMSDASPSPTSTGTAPPDGAQGSLADGLQHVMISASAGSGKTYQLVRRFLHLMTLGAKPQQIAAMTFTRKASGEFFNRILNRLAELAKGELDPDRYFAGMEPWPPAWPDFTGLLRETTQTMQQLRLGTLDSFFANVAACFPLELGLPLGARVMAEEESKEAREQVIAGLIERVFRERDEVTARALVEAFKQATFGSEEKRADESLLQWIETGHDRWLESDGPDAWGKPARIWPKRQGLGSLPDLSAAVAHLRTALDARKLFTPKGADKWESMLDALVTTEPGLTLPDSTKALLKTCAAVWTALRQGAAEISIFSNKRQVSGPAARALVDVCETLLHRELLVRCARTQGTAQLLARYEAEHALRVRSRGSLSFADVQRLLARAAREWLLEGEGAPLWYRLDSRYEHWLFDEFQDTSFQQWHVISGLVDEVLQSDSGRRSFFAVGDPKQSIYLWRQAEPRLFRQLMSAHPPALHGGIHVQHLSASQRSAQEVLDMVNAVCGDISSLDLHLPGIRNLWEFHEHVSARQNLRGYAALLWPDKVDEEQPKAEDVVVRLLREVRPLERGLSCAILVRGNDTGRELANLIRAETGMEVVCESEQFPATDNPVTLALLSILQLAAHPGDRFAFQHLQMTPLRRDSWHRSTSETLSLIFQDGFTGFAKKWIAEICAVLPNMDAFTLRRCEQLADMAAEFDVTGSRDVDAFIRFARAYRLRTRGASAAIQVMTVHAAKGLEFDMVIVPELSSTGMNQLRSRHLIVHREAHGQVDWILQEPPKDYVPFDEALTAERSETELRTGFESLCRLYVAMTRAKRGLYLVLEKPVGEGGKSVNEARVLRDLLCGETALQEDLDGVAVSWGWEKGARDWFLVNEVRAAPAIEEIAKRPPLGDLLRERQPLPKRRTPSGEEDFKVKGKVLFSAGRNPGRQLGTLLHAMMEQVEWIDGPFEPETMITIWKGRGFDRNPAFEQALPQALGTLSSLACRAAFTRPGAGARLWRERPFDLVQEDGEWISGTVDRVILECDPAGKPVRATIIDFKTDEVSDDAALAEKLGGYAPQIALYRQAVARLASLPPEKVLSFLLFTRTGRLEQV